MSVVRRRSVRTGLGIATLGLVFALAMPPVRTTRAAPQAGRVVYVALGGSHTVGSGAANPATDCYPALLARYLPPGAHYVNLAANNVGVLDALTSQLPQALADHPTLVTVWLGINELTKNVAPDIYRTALDRLLMALYKTKAHLVIGNIPDPLKIPNPLVAQQQYVAPDRAYNHVIDRLATHYHAVVVDIYHATDLLWGNPAYVDNSGFLPVQNGYLLTTKGYAALAQLFYRAMRRHHLL